MAISKFGMEIANNSTILLQLAIAIAIRAIDVRLM